MFFRNSQCGKCNLSKKGFSCGNIYLYMKISINSHKMAKADKFKQFLPDRKSDKLSYDVPTEQQPVTPDRIPSGYDPIEQAQLEARAFRALAGGKIHWWILISGWIFLGTPSLVIICVLASPLSWGSIPLILIASIPLITLCRGTKAKFSNWRARKNER
jgi:hypothetical protein